MYLSKVPDVFVQIANRICPIKRAASGRGPGNFSQLYRELKAGQPSCEVDLDEVPYLLFAFF